MKTLTLIIPSDWPQQRRECPWFVRNDAGNILEQGCSEPAHWPGLTRTQDMGASEAYDCDLLLAGEQIVCQRVQLPSTARGRLPEVIAAALEDSLLEPAERLLFASAESSGSDGCHAVAVIGRARFEAIVRLVQELGLTPRRAWPLGLALPPATGLLCGGELTFALTDGSFFGLRADSQLSDWLALQRAADDASPPTPVAYALLERDVPAAIDSLLREQEQAGHLRRLPAADIHLRPPQGPGLLYGELAPPRPHQALGRIFRPALRATVGFAGIVLMTALVQWAWYSWQAQGYRKDIAKHFHQALGSAAMVDPLRQMQRQVAQARRATGQLADDDFLRLLKPLGTLPAGSLKVQEITYDNGSLRVTAHATREGMAQLHTACQQQGIALHLPTEQATGDGALVSLQLSSGEVR